MSNPTPTGINADRSAGTVTISWSDGEEFVYPFALLRNACPCAECRGGHENMKSEPDDDVLIIPIMDANITKLVDISAVGNYAICITWGDGHKAGIYNWHYLYALGIKTKEEG
jgi:DUF971 family protein